MYGVIMAGGGGTRLHPLSRAERPKPFLPLLGPESLLQATAARLRPLTDDITVVTDRRYEGLVRDQLPDVALLLEPLGRNTAAAIALATLAIDRSPDEVMLVLPADQTIEREEAFRDVLRAAAEHLATGAFGIDDPLVTLGVQPDHAATEYGYLLPAADRGEDIAGLRAYPLHGFEEKPNPARAEQLQRETGIAWNAGMFLWRRRAIRAALERYTGLVQTLGPMVSSPAMLERAYESIQKADVDRLRGHGGRRPRWARPDGGDGRRLVRPRLVVGAPRGARLERDRGGRPGRRDRDRRRRRPRRPPDGRSPRGHRAAGAG